MRRAVLALLLVGCGSHPSAKCTMMCDPLKFTTLELLAGQPGGSGWVDAQGAAAHFEDPWTFASDGTNLFLADGNLIRQIDPAGNVTTLAGSALIFTGSDGVGEAASFFTPSGLAWLNGAVYITDTENHTLRKLDPSTRTVTTVAGALGQPGNSDGAALEARFREPEGLCADQSGNLYLADVDNNLIRKLSPDGMVTTIAGSGLNGADDGIGLAATFSRPKAMAYDGTGSLYIVDAGNAKVRKLSLADQSVTTVAAFAATPLGVAFANGDLFVSLGDHTVVRNSMVIAGVSNMSGFDETHLNQPAGLYSDGSSLWIADDHNYAIRKLDLTTNALTTFAGARSSGSADGANARFSGIAGLISDAQFVYAADAGNHTIRKIELASGAVSTLAGTAGQTGNGDGVGADARFNLPADLALDGKTLYVVDSSNQYVRKIDLDSAAVTTTVAQPQPGFTYLKSAAGVAFDGGKLYISDVGNNDIAELDLAKSTIRVLAKLPGPTGLRADGNGHLFVCGQSESLIVKVDIKSGAVTTVAGMSGIQGSDDGMAASFAFPTAIAIDGAGELFVADSLNHLVRKIDASGTSTLIGSRKASGVLLGALPAQLTSPSALALTPDGKLIVASENSLLRAR